MDTPTSRQFSLTDLGRLAGGLRRLVDGCDDIRQSHLRVNEFFNVPSEAAEDAVDPYGPRILDLLGAVNIAFAAALDNADHLTSVAQSAAEGEPTNAWASVSVSRSTIEILSRAAWLMQPNIGPQARAARLLSMRRSEVTSQLALGEDFDPESHTRLKERRSHIDRLAYELGLAKTNHRGRGQFSTGFAGESVPSLSRLVQDLLGDRWSYSILSAVAHGETWVTLQWAFVVDESASSVPGTSVAKKEPPVIGLVYTTGLAFEALSKTAEREAIFRGWSPERTRDLVTEAGGLAYTA